MKIKITDKERQKVEEFADARLGSAEHYRGRGGFKRADLIAGALGEIAAYKVLKRAGHELAKPDFEIYEKGQKSYDADLRIMRKKFHVKTQTKESAERYGKSWLMQRYDPIFNGSGYNEYLVCCVADLDTNSVEVLGYFPVFTILKKGLIGQCKVPSFRHSKVAIYFDMLDVGISHKSRWRVVKCV